MSRVMHRLSVRLLLLVGAAHSGVAQDPAPPVSLEDLAKQQLKGAMRAEAFESRALGRKAPFLVYLPPGHDDAPGRRFPLLLFLHGLFEDRHRWVSRAGPQIIEAEILAGRMPPAVVAVPEGGTGLWLDARAGRDRYRTFLVEDFLPHLEKEFRVDDARATRWVLGVSMGGSGALALAFARPDLFGAVAAHDPMILPDDPAAVPGSDPFASHPFVRRPLREVFGDPIDPSWWERNHPCALARALDPEKAPAIRIDSSTGNRFGLHAGASRLHSLLESRGIRHGWSEHTGDGGSETLREYLPASLRFFAGSAGASPATQTGADKNG